MLDLIYHCDIGFDRARLLQEYRDLKASHFSAYNPEWKKTHASGPYGSQIRDQFDAIVGYYHQPAGTVIRPHTDTLCSCRINVRLTNDDGKLIVNEREYYYETALINVSKYAHSVSQSNQERILFSVIFNEEFDAVKNLIHRMSKTELQYQPVI